MPSATHLDDVPRRALGAVVIAILLWTSNVLFVRHAGDVLAFTTWRMVFAIPVLAVTAVGVRVNASGDGRVERGRAELSGWTWAAIFLIGAVFGLSAFVNFVSINETTLVNVGVIHALQPAVVAVVAGRYLGEIVDWRLLARAGIALAGAFIVAAASTGQGSWSLHGDALAVLGLTLNCGWFLAGRWVRTRTDLDATRYMFAVFSSGAAVLLLIVAVTGRPFLVDASTIVYAALTALIGTIGHTLMAWAHRYVPAAISSLFLLSQPALIAVLAWLAFGEGLSVLHVIGGALVMGSLAAVVRHSRAAEEIEGVAPASADPIPEPAAPGPIPIPEPAAESMQMRIDLAASSGDDDEAESVRP